MFKRGLSQSELHVGLISSKYYPAVMLTLSMLVTFVLQAGRPRSASNSDLIIYSMLDDPLSSVSDLSQAMMKSKLGTMRRVLAKLPDQRNCMMCRAFVSTFRSALLSRHC